MVLLRGANYDFSCQEKTFLTREMGKGATTIEVENTSGFSDDDYLLVNPYTEKAEIVRINAAVSENKKLTITANTFIHPAKTKIYRLPYNQMKFYSATTATGTYTEIVTVSMNYSNLFTNYNYNAGTAALYYKRTFYNEVLAQESDIDLTVYWQTGDEELYVTPPMIRSFMQLGPNDYPIDLDLWNYLRLAQDKFSLDADTSNSIIRKLAVLFLAKSYILRGLATKSVAKGYVTVNAEGRQITKSFQELVLEAENTEEEYKNFLINNVRSEVSKTNYLNDTTIIASENRQEILDLLTGTQNVMDYDSYKRSVGRRRRY